MSRPPTPRRLLWCAAALLLLAAALQFMLRGPIDHRGTLRMYDFAMHYSSAQSWLNGHNPYDNKLLWTAWLERGGRAEGMMPDIWLSVLPPSSFVVFAPLALLPARVAVVAWICLSLAMVALMLWAVIALTGLRGAWAGLFVAGALASAPIQTLVTVGQASLPSIALILLAIERAMRGKPIVAGLLLGLSACLKPQLALPFAAYFAFARNWRVLTMVLGTTALLTLVAIIPMQMHGHDWLGQWLTNIASSSAPGRNNDPTISGPWREQMIHLPLWLFSFVADPRVVMTTSWTICIALFLAYVRFACQCRGDQKLETLSLATLAALILLPVYHKSYDAAILLPAFAWALREIDQDSSLRGMAIGMVSVMAVFLIPFSFLTMVMERTDALNAISQTMIWRVLVVPHHAVATLVVALCMLWALRQRVRGGEPSVVGSTDQLSARSAESLSRPAWYADQR